LYCTEHVQNFRKHFAVSSLLAKLSVTVRKFDAIAERRLVVSDFLDANLVGTNEVTLAELQGAYNGGNHPFRGQPFEEVQDVLRRYLGQSNVQRAVVRWVEGLKQLIPYQVLTYN
jgi:hypothetical protein